MNQIAVEYDAGLLATLTDPDEATAYLIAALEEDDQEVFLLALHDIVNAYRSSQDLQPTH